MPLTIVLPSRRNNGHENNDFAAFVETQIDRAAQKIIDSSNQRYDEHAHGKLSYLLSLRRVMSQKPPPRISADRTPSTMCFKP